MALQSYTDGLPLKSRSHSKASKTRDVRETSQEYSVDTETH